MSNQDKFNFDDLTPNFQIGAIIGDNIQNISGDDRITVDYSHMRVLPMRRVVMFPYIAMPLPIGRDTTRLLLNEAMEKHEAIFLATQKDFTQERPGPDDVYTTGVVGKVIKMLDLPDGNTAAIIQAGGKARIRHISMEEPFLTASVEISEDTMPEEQDMEAFALMATVEEIFHHILESYGDSAREMAYALSQIESPVRRMAYIGVNAPLSTEEKMMLLEIDSFAKRIEKLVGLLDRSSQLLDIKNEVANRTHQELSMQQKEHFLQAQIRAIKSELGDDDEDDFVELQKRADGKTWSAETGEQFRKELRKLTRFNPSSPDYATQYSYLDHFLNLPWLDYSEEQIDIAKVEDTLNKEHYGLEKVKERIVEHIAVLKLRGDMKSPIICLAGPPGVGKTSLGKSVADALGREYARVSLGGLHDEAEIRGHRRTYIGAMPGRILSALAKCKKGNPVFVLDEIDKIGQDFKGDPAQALLEVLDPEQNSGFHDNFIDCDYDLSKILFIATANSLSTISAPLLDRMEIIDISGYISAEKIEIAARHLVPRNLENHGFGSDEVTFTRDALLYMIESYTRESGVRKLDKTISKVLRKLAVKKAKNEEYPSVIDRSTVSELLGKEDVMPDIYEDNETPGIVTGLAWTSVGGEILFIESSLSKGKGALTLTGNLGDVMKESATIALQWLRAHGDRYGIDPERYANTDVHVHVPEGAIPKDGPSAGITMATSLASSFTGRKVRARLAMTGEITLRGKVLPVGGIKEKILAAKRAGITEIMLSDDNRKDIQEIRADYLEGLSFHYVRRVEDVLDYALLPA